MKRLVIDLDHTICVPDDGDDQPEDASFKYRSAKPVRALIDQLRHYRELGFHIVIHTSRNMRTFKGDVETIKRETLPIILAWLSDHEVPYDEVVVGKPWCGFDGFYVDDRAVRPSEFVGKSFEELTALIAAERAAR